MCFFRDSIKLDVNVRILGYGRIGLCLSVNGRTDGWTSLSLSLSLYLSTVVSLPLSLSIVWRNYFQCNVFVSTYVRT